MGDARPSKRARNDASSKGSREDTTAGYKRSENFWLRDGNVILVAEKTAFRVHQSVLERKSVVFQDMFGVPQPEEAETLEECPLVHVSDTAEDITHMLSVLYDGDRFLNMNTSISMKMVFALLQLGIKYQIDYLRDEAISVLEVIYPPSFAKYVLYQQSNSTLRVTEQTYTQDPIVVINLAWKHNLPSLLPGAFFVCALLPNRTLAAAAAGAPAKDDQLTKLSVDDLVRCLNGREALQSMFLDRYAFLDKGVVTEGCISPRTCEGSLTERRQDHMWTYVNDVVDRDFDPLQVFDWVEWLHVCDPCRREFEQADYEARQKIYEAVPGMFELLAFMKEHAET
ncbi:hypothetical protein EIP91_005097 [Steccherinum ochraceum]|uniref:BTB domain-containing protein n=1 Tax=Steccherinum ochraceum TaxID=92696 RepID=A0A4R0R835_9APHY|nr:hypothetical protein EIP91_005097 [Steccherinum ochraceum]